MVRTGNREDADRNYDRWTQATRACVWLVLNKTRDKDKKIYTRSRKV